MQQHILEPITLEGHFGKADLKSAKEVTPGHVSSFGVPKILHRGKKHIYQ